uniref:Uncharacterized protein n=1 Tax=Anguilla anguilla TaxID=7936 RepID=A0A0E9SVK9_ANGAN
MTAVGLEPRNRVKRPVNSLTIMQHCCLTDLALRPSFHPSPPHSFLSLVQSLFLSP